MRDDISSIVDVLPWWQGKAARKNWRLPAVRVDRATNSRRTRLHQTNLTGDAHLCTPPGENIYLSLGGGMNLNVSTDGEGINLYMDGRSPMANILRDI